MDQYLKPHTHSIGKVLYVTQQSPLARVREHQFNKWLAALIFNEALNFNYQIKQDYTDLRLQQGKTHWYIYANKDASQEQTAQLQAAYDAICAWKLKQSRLTSKTQPVDACE